MDGYTEIDINGKTAQQKKRTAGVVFALLCLSTLALIARKKQLAENSSTLIETSADPSVEEQTESSSDYCIETSVPVLGGYDVVSYFSLNEGDDAVLGSSDYSYQFNGNQFYFSSEENMKKFIQEPKHYAPRFGAFCAYGISSEDFWTWDAIIKRGPSADPNVWLIKDEKLYLFMYEVPKRKFLTGNVDERISKGIENWYSFTGGKQADYYNSQCLWWDSECGHEGDYCVSDYEAMLEISAV